MNMRSTIDAELDRDGLANVDPGSAGDDRSLREMMCVLVERMRHLPTRPEVRELASRFAVLEERISHTATKAWVLGGVVAVLIGVLGGFWWIAQQYLSPLLQAAS